MRVADTIRKIGIHVSGSSWTSTTISMHRRGNKSKKVPNVKLRPANAMVRARASPEHTSCWAEESEIAEDNTAISGGTRPFKSVVLCATGAVDKPALFQLARDLGATSTSAFTDRVTHLVAENHGGAKYKCALERKIPILLPSWITESHRVWQQGDDVDLARSVAAHRLPVFAGVTLCVSGIDNIVHRTQINKALTAAGGTYVATLEPPVHVTHLLCTGEVDTDKMRDAEELNRVRLADPPIQLVWEEWFWDSLEYHGRFDETLYRTRRPRRARREPSIATISHPIPIEAADDDGDELAPVQRHPTVALQLWGSLLKARGYEVDVARGAVVLPGSSEASPHTQYETQVDTGGGVLSSLRRANSILAPRTTASAGLPFRRSGSTSVMLGKRRASEEEGEGEESVKRGRV
ncbi:hypothetical protein DFH06DRAFT_468904 [Mycena polygramma]|nr:hypothetical protein DFH06DRAFT_468904 [Mycena polygramma]